jgi:hypothetical protein
MAEAGILIASESFLTDWEGQRRIFTAGQTTIREGHPLVKGREQMFKPLTVDYELPEPKKDEGAHRRPGQSAGSRAQAKQG